MSVDSSLYTADQASCYEEQQPGVLSSLRFRALAGDESSKSSNRRTITVRAECSMKHTQLGSGLYWRRSVCPISTNDTCPLWFDGVADWTFYSRGYVALAVATEKETSTKEVETGLGGDREGNMVAFALEGLKLLRDVIKGNAKL